MVRKALAVLLFTALTSGFVQAQDLKNRKFLKALYSDRAYMEKRDRITASLKNVPAGKWGEFVKGVDEELATKEKIVAFTFDACGGGRKSNRFNARLIKLLREERVPATLFVTGLWIDANPQIFKELAADTLFEIENHGFNHKPLAVKGESEYGIKGTADPADAYDEMEANALKIEKITGRRPQYYRSATAYTDEAGVKIAEMLGITVISYDVLSGDAVEGTPTKEIEQNVLRNVEPGAIIIMHFNHPESNTCEAMRTIIPELRKSGYHFVHLKGMTLKGKNPTKPKQRK